MQLYSLLQLTDSAFPSGAFAHSGGLEGFFAQAGPVPAGELAAVAESLWTEQLLHADGVLGLAVHRAAARDDLDAVFHIDHQLHALKLSRELRAASLRTGRAFLDEASRILASRLLDEFAAAVASAKTPGNYVAAFMAACAVITVDEESSLLAWGYQTVNQLAAALLRLGVVGHRGATALVARLRPIVEAGVRELVAAPEPAVSSFAPCLEIASMAHERQYSRLFQS